MFPPALLSVSLSLLLCNDLQDLSGESELKLSHEILKVLCTPGCFHVGIGDIDLWVSRCWIQWVELGAWHTHVRVGLQAGDGDVCFYMTTWNFPDVASFGIFGLCLVS